MQSPAGHQDMAATFGVLQSAFLFQASLGIQQTAQHQNRFMLDVQEKAKSDRTVL